MGWLYMQSLRGHAGPRAYLDAQFTYERPEHRSRVLRSALVAMQTYYAALEIVRAGGEREVTALVCLVRYNPRDRDGYIFGYKDRDESMGPCESECPPAILDLLMPTERPYAVAWRERCRTAAARRASKPKLRSGQTIVFAEPITFSDGATFDRMVVVLDPHRPRQVRFRPAEGPGLYRISHLDTRDYRVEDTSA